MSHIKAQIENLNKNALKALTVYLTAGFPDHDGFEDLVINVIENGADLIEIGVPFSDPIADGPTIQYSSEKALSNNINLRKIFAIVKNIKLQKNTPIILMGYANPILQYGVEKFQDDCLSNGIDGIIVPDLPIDELEEFHFSVDKIDTILLTTPTSKPDRIKEIDEKSSGFVYCVSITGTTGKENIFNEAVIEKIKNTYSLVKRNKMMIGFGISKAQDIQMIKNYCDGVIVGSAIIKKLQSDSSKNYTSTMNFVKDLKIACNT